MTTTKKTQNTAPLAHRVPAEVSDLIATYSAWLEEQTGVKIDPMSVYLGSQLRGTFQKTPANQKRIADAAKARTTREAAKSKARAEREAKSAGPKESKPAPKAKASAKALAKAPARRRPAKPAPAATVEV